LTDFRKIIKYEFYENPSSGSRVVPFGPLADGRKDRYDEAYIALCNFTKAPKKVQG